MPYELTCPSCQARLLLKDDTGEEYLLCPRCLSMVPRPSAAPQPVAAAGSGQTGVQDRWRGVNSVESDLKRATWPAYFIILGITLLAIVGLILPMATVRGDAGWLLWPLFLMVLVLTALVLFPIGRGLAKITAPMATGPRPHKAGRAVLIIGLLAVLAPVAFAIVFFTVCSATLVAVLSTH
jgi:hypothetical protein